MNKLCARAARYCPPPASHSAPTQAHCQQPAHSDQPVVTPESLWLSPAPLHKAYRLFCACVLSRLLYKLQRVIIQFPAHAPSFKPFSPYSPEAGEEWRQSVSYGERLAGRGPALGFGGRLPIPASSLFINRAAGRPEMTPSFSPEPPKTTRASRGPRSCAPS